MFKTNSKGGFLLRNKTNLEGVYVAVPDRTHYYKLYITKKVKIQTFATYRKTYDYSKKKYTKGANTTVLSKSYSAFTL